jgi:ubiquinone/menaquinone biosynthesis C-methylase UbiE
MVKVALFGTMAVAIGFLWAARALVFHVLPLAWTGEADRLAAFLKIGPGNRIAEIGAGTGVLAAEMAGRVGLAGAVFATELNPERRAEIARRAAGLPQLAAVEAAPDATKLPFDCCDAIYMRAVLHHIEAPDAYARELARAVRPGGRVGVIDFPPGALFMHGADHGIDARVVLRAFTAAGLELEGREDDWGGAMYLLTFRKPARE